MGHLVLVGAGHSHLLTLLAIPRFAKRGHRVTVVSPGRYHYYSGMAPGLLAGQYEPRQARFDVLRMAEDRGAAFVLDRAVGVDPVARTVRLASGGSIDYDVASFNVGSTVPFEIPPGESGRVLTVKPIENFLRAAEAVESAVRGEGSRLRALVVGGGPAGVETAGGLWGLARRLGARIGITLLAGRRLLWGHPDRLRYMAAASLARRGIDVRTGSRLRGISGGEAVLEDGSALPADLALVAVGVRPAPLFLHSLIPTGADGGLLVNRHLQSVEYPQIFGGGDCVTHLGMPLARVGVYAVRQNGVLRDNLLAALGGRPLKAFSPGSPNYLFIMNMGDGTGLARKGRWTMDGRAAFLLKDWIDRRFMRRFQVSGENLES